jgi:hypothetical protein
MVYVGCDVVRIQSFITCVSIICILLIWICEVIYTLLNIAIMMIVLTGERMVKVHN